jgi:hypothetical protein
MQLLMNHSNSSRCLSNVTLRCRFLVFIICTLVLYDFGNAFVSNGIDAVPRIFQRRLLRQMVRTEQKQLGYVESESDSWRKGSNLTSLARLSTDSRIKPFSLTDSFNSTTLRSLIFIREEVENFFTK